MIRTLDEAGITRTSQTVLHIKEAINTRFDDDGDNDRGPDAYSKLPDGSTFIGTIDTTIYNEQDETPETIYTYDGVEIFWWYGKCHEEILKPLIIVEGFDEAGEASYEQMFGDDDGPGLLNGAYGFSDETPLEDKFFEVGYDIFYINYADGGGDIFENGAYVRDAILAINAMKGEGAEENVVMGASMGGLTAKIALRTMENDGIDHETSSFLSFDAPLKGANLPLGLQAAVFDLAQTTVFGVAIRDKIDAIGTKEKLLDSKAARQMSYYHIKSCSNYNCDASGYDNLHDAFYGEFDALGNLDIPHYAIANGSINGVSQLYSPGTLLANDNLTLTGGSGWNFLNYLGPLHFLSIRAKAWALPGNEDNLVYEKNMQHIVLFTLFESYSFCSITNAINYDTAPGGMRGFNVIKGGVEIIDIPWKEKQFCFIPTISALGLNITDPFYAGVDLTDVNTITGNGTSYTRAYVGAVDSYTHPVFPGEGTYVNMKHISLDNPSANFLLSKFLPSSGPGETPMTIYNYGEAPLNYVSPLTAFIAGRTPNTLKHSIAITDHNEIWINRNNRIAYIDNNDNPINTLSSNFDLNISPSCDEDNIWVTISNGGKWITGEWSNGIENTARVNVLEGVIMTVSTGGEISVNAQSEIRIKDGAVLRVESGGLLEASFSGKIYVEEGGLLTIASNATLKIHGASQLIVEEGGKLIIEPNANIELWDGTNTYGQAVIDIFGELALGDEFNFSGNGYFKFERDNILSFSGAHIFKINNTLTSRFIEIAANAHLDIQGNSISLYNGIVKYNASSSIKGGAGARFSFYNTDFEGEETATAISADHAVQLVINTCKFDNFGTGIDAYNVYSPLFFIENSVFQYNRVAALFITGAGTVRVNNSVFRGDNESVFAMLLTDISSFNLLNSTVEDFMHDHAIQLAEDMPEFVMSGGFIQNNAGAGIYVPPYSRSNIFLRDQATIADNGTGIFIENGADENSPLDYGLVLMDCANLLNNGIGIRGRDVLLQIDAYDNLGGNDPSYLRPNHFQKPADGLMFDIFYQIRDELEVSATGNYWGTDNAAFQNIGTPGHAPLFYNDLENGYDLIVPLIISNPVAQAPTGCPIPPNNPDTNPPSDKSCLLTGGGIFDGIIAHEEYAFAYRAFDEKLANQSTTSDIKGMFGKLSGISDGERSNASEACKQYIDVSKVMISAEIMKADIEGNNIFLSGANDTGKALFQSNKQQKGMQEVQDIHLFPNPAKGEFQIQLPNTSNEVLTIYQVNIFDNLGKSVFFEETDENLLVKTSRWTAGLYYVVLTAKVSGKVTSLKIIVE